MSGVGKLLNIRNVNFAQVRTLIKRPPLPEEGGIKCHGFTYYPRKPDFKDPPYEPTKLFFVKRLCRMTGLNPQERNILRLLNIDGEVRFQQHLGIVKNIPEVNALLWKVKHLVKITPIRCINGLPKDGDCTGTYLRDNGEFIVSEKIKIDPKRVEACERFISDKNKLGPEYMKNYLRLKWDDPYSADV